MFLKTIFLVGLALAFAAHLVASSFSGTAHAAMILVDGDAAGGYLLNGSFETGSDGNPDSWRGADGNTTLAADLGINGNMLHRTAPANASDGSRYTVIGANNGAATVTGVFLNTGYQLVLGDTFDLSFFHGSHGGVGPPATLSLEGGETFAWSLFTTTTNTDSGVVDDVLATGTVNANVSFTLTNVSLPQVGSVTASSVGETLFLAFTPVIADGDFFALDQVNLSVISIPEPSAVLLLLGALPALCPVMRSRLRKLGR